MADVGVEGVVVVVVVEVEHRDCEEEVVVVVVDESVCVARVELEVVAEVEGGGGPIWGTICSLTDFSMAPRGSILLTDSLSCESGPPPLVKSGELRSYCDEDLDMPELPLPLPMFIMFIMEPLLMRCARGLRSSSAASHSLFMSGGT